MVIRKRLHCGADPWVVLLAYGYVPRVASAYHWSQGDRQPW